MIPKSNCPYCKAELWNNNPSVSACSGALSICTYCVEVVIFNDVIINRTRQTAYISKKIIELRESVDWSQSELARRTGITSAAISQIEKGDRLPSLIVCRKLAESFNVSMDELIGDTSISSKDVNEET